MTIKQKKKVFPKTQQKETVAATATEAAVKISPKALLPFVAFSSKKAAAKLRLYDAINI